MKPLTPDGQLRFVSEKLSELQRAKFYGRVTLDIQGGNVLRIVKEESIKLGASHVHEGTDEVQAPSRAPEAQTEAPQP